jgi:phenylacetate-CoA ligase
MGYASSMYSMAQTAIEKGIPSVPLNVALSNAEPLYRNQREAISQAFQCSVREAYGMAEIVCTASECAEGRMHLWPEVGMVEVFDDTSDELMAPSDTGRLICTGLLNADMPLIRYEVGDRGSLAHGEVKCNCGGSLPVLKQVEGRLDDVILTRDGRKVGRLDPVFKADLKIREAQIIQEDFDTIRVKFIPAIGYQEQDGLAIASRLHDRLGDMDIILEPVNQIPRNANGKFKAVVSRIFGKDASDIRL